MINKIKKIFSFALAIVSSAFTFVPENLFSIIEWSIVSYILKMYGCTSVVKHLNITLNRVLFFVIVIITVTLFYYLYLKYRKSITIKGDNYIIKVKYGNILKESNCKRVIAFDECFTTNVGILPNEIKETSICGQYLRANPNLNVPQLIEDAKLTKAKRKSKFKHQDCYKSGTIVANGDDLLLAFAPLDESGRGVFPSYESYLDSLFLLWKELDKYYAQQDVCISILGSGITRIGDGMESFLTQQKLLEMIVGSYKLSPYKLKKPYKLRIVCKKRDDFSLNNI